jgi:hypothetical protein
VPPTWPSEKHGEPCPPLAAILTAVEFGLLAMHEKLSRALGADVFSPEGHLRTVEAKIDFY